MASRWYVYVLECADETLYTGITTDPERRVREHNESAKGARYTRSRRPVSPVAVWPCEDRSQAASEEAAFKSLSRDEKIRRLRVASDPDAFATFEREYRRTFAPDDPAPDACRPISLADREPEVLDRARRVAKTCEQATEKLAERLSGEVAHTGRGVEPVFCVGPGLFDGHGVLLEAGPRVFFDMRLVDRHFEREAFAPLVHALHETTHALHYAARPAMYPGREKSPAEEVWHRLVAEGLACRLAERITDSPPATALWFGYLDDAEYADWRKEAERARSEVWDRVRDADESLRFDSETWRRLFRGRGDSTTNRIGYWYAREIVRRAEGDHPVSELLTAPPETWYGYVREYFES